MKKNKWTAVLSASALSLSLLAPVAASDVQASSTYENWNVERYGDRIDIDGQLEKKSESESFQKQAKQQIKENAKGTSFDSDSEDSDSNGTAKATSISEGITKQFLTRDLAFKTFTLRSIGENVEVWVANDLSFPEDDPRDPHVITQEQADKMAAEFDENIYPKATGFFGMPDSLDGTNAQLEDLGLVPEGYYEGEGDNIVLLVDNVQDDNYNDPEYPFFVAGFFWQTIENYTDRNIITIDSNNWQERLESTFFATTIHELQHLIHADNDSDETSWLNEGMSTFSEYLGGYGLSTGSVNFFLDHPENSLINWDEHVDAKTGPETIADYGLVQLFTLYNYERFGQEFIRSVAKDDKNSIQSYEDAYKEFGLNVTFNEVYQDFSTALVVDDDQFKGGKYGFENVDLRELPTEDGERGFTVNFEKAKDYEKDGVPAWGTDFKEFNFSPHEKVDTLTFNGIDFESNTWESVDSPLGTDDQVLWGGEGNELDNNLIFEADLTNVEEATLTFDHFIDIEEQWDFGVVQVSTDDGETWTSLANENTRSDVVAQGYPKIKENLPGFTGHYEDFQKESFDLSKYAGQDIHISFRYLTDWGYNDTGWFIDDIQIPEIGLNFDGTTKEPFMSKSELLEEYVNYGVTFIKEKNNGKYQVIEVDPFNITDEEALDLQQALRKGKTYMTTYFASPQDSLNPVPFEYGVEYKENNGKNKGKEKKDN